ncbi:MAG: helix-turn-helix domain-containing protein [Asticcacaulis sp.]
MSVWKFSVQSLPSSERAAAWADVMRRLRLPQPADFHSSSDRPLTGNVSIATTPMGCEFALIDSVAQTYTGRAADQEPAIWLALMLKGQACIESAGLPVAQGSVEAGRGAIIYGTTGTESTLYLLTDFRLAMIRIPQLMVSPRLVMPLGSRVGVLEGQKGIERVFSILLTGVAQTLDSLTDDDFLPVEQSIIECLIACLDQDGNVENRGGATGARAAHLRRVCQKIETMLHDPDLTLTRVAEAHGISARYLQKLFSDSQLTFSGYVRLRRLERCHADLISPVYSQLSISEICFRWGFNEAAHFSRSFRERYHVSPRAHRQKALGLKASGQKDMAHKTAA